MKNSIILSIFIWLSACNSLKTNTQLNIIEPGAHQIQEYQNFLRDKSIAIVANHTSTIGKQHLVDSLLSLQINVKKIFCPEHGFRGNADAGELINNSTDTKTGLPVISLYGSHKKPMKNDLEGIDLVVFDIQDVGVRFYTYISTLHYVMEACAENNIPLLVLDRPNPNGFYVDGPVLDTNFSSFVGLHPVPLVHGMTIGEYAKMINGEQWLKNKVQCKLEIIRCKNYSHDSLYQLPVKPSPNLPNMQSVYLYPSLGLFEGTIVSIGRGTDFPFQVFGHPHFKNLDFSFTPESRPGASKNPKHKNLTCYGIDLREVHPDFIFEEGKINIEWLIFAYQKLKNEKNFFNSYFKLLAGNNNLQEQIEQNSPPIEIRNSWKTDLEKFHEIRKKYLLYKHSDYEQ